MPAFLRGVACAFGLALVACSNSATSFSLPAADQTFGQVISYNNKVDILFVIDNSKSMLQYQNNLARKIPELIVTLNSLKMDYHVAVTSSTMAADSSRYPMTRQILGTPKFLTVQNINLLGDRLLVGESGSDLERSLDAMAFVTGAYAQQSAPGFLRADALLAVIFLGEEDDQSSEFGSGNSNDFLNYLNRLKPPFKEGGRAWIANYIGTISNQMCDNLGGFVSIGTSYLRLVTASNGIKESICNSDLSAAVTNIKTRIVGQLTQFYLKSAPNKSMLKISVGGRVIIEDPLNGWTLESETNVDRVQYFIRFHGTSVPKADEGIKVDYLPLGAG